MSLGKLSLEREVRASNLGPVKSDTVLPTARYCSDISSRGAVLPRRNDAEFGPANSLQASSIMKDLIWIKLSTNIHSIYFISIPLSQESDSGGIRRMNPRPLVT